MTISCVDPGTVDSMEIEECDGENWEQWNEQYTAKQKLSGAS